jgi:hypothetical protein
MVAAMHQRVLLVPFLMAYLCHAQSTNGTDQQNSAELNVNWLYGAYLPKSAPRNTLSGKQRLKLYARQTFTTPGIYLKTMLFAAGDQINNSPPGWGEAPDGYFRRAASRQAQFVLQNSFVAWGNWKLGYEPRYDRCKCSGFWKRTGYAAARNFVTYDRSQRWFRPQIALYAGAFTAGVLAGTWKPKDRNLAAEGYRAMFTQAAFGVGANWLGEFAPDLIRILRRKRTSN